MRILQLGKFYPIRGGVEKVMYDLTVGLSARGIECDMLCAAYKGRSRKIAVGERVRVICCRTWMKLAGTMISPALLFKAVRMCKRYDIVHVHHPDPMAALALYLSGYEGRVILHWHSDIIKQKNCLKFYRPLQDWLIGRAELILGTTPIYIKESPYLKAVLHKTACLPIGVTPVVPQDEKVKMIQARYPGKKIVFSLGRLVSYKGFEHLIRAARYLSDDYVILIGGIGPLIYDLTTEIEAWGVSRKVVLLGRICEEDLSAYYGACTLFCLPSVQKTEAFGIVQIEAMSCGKPVVATNIPGSGVSWVNKDGFSGLNVPPADPEALAGAIREITRDEETCRTYSQNALAHYRATFTQDRMIDQCIEYYNNHGKEQFDCK